MLLTKTRLPVCALSLSETEIDQYTMFVSMVVQKVRRLDVSVKDASLVYVCQPTKQAQEIVSQIVGKEVPIV